jgi:hypothetical protein
MKKFVVIMRNEGPVPSQQQMGELISEMFAWLKELKSKSLFDGGEFLMDDGGTTLKKVGDQVRMGGPYSASKEQVRGFYFFKAKDQIEILEHCRRCPVLNFGWLIELREVDAV